MSTSGSILGWPLNPEPWEATRLRAQGAADFGQRAVMFLVLPPLGVPCGVF